MYFVVLKGGRTKTDHYTNEVIVLGDVTSLEFPDDTAEIPGLSSHYFPLTPTTLKFNVSLNDSKVVSGLPVLRGLN